MVKLSGNESVDPCFHALKDKLHSLFAYIYYI